MKKEEIDFIVDKIKNLSASIEHNFTEQYMSNTYGEGYYEEYSGYNESWLKQSIESLYYLILAYFESKSFLSSYETFKNQFKTLIENKNDLLKEKQYHPEEEAELIIMHNYFLYLNPFPDFSNKNNIDEYFKLQSILRNTNHIIEKLNIVVKREADIYKEVRWIIGLYFPKTRLRNKASFIQEFKSYHPDILIPELKTAVEYKFINVDDENHIEKYIDELKIDSVNYIGDQNYNRFIAVIYRNNNSLSTPEMIIESWKSKNFPKNWELIISTA